MERYYSGDSSRALFDVESEDAQTVMANVQAAFPWAKLEDYLAVSSPVEHEVLSDEVVTGFMPLASTTALAGPQYGLGSRKFCMRSKTSFLRLYRVFDMAKPLWLPPSVKVYAIGENHTEFARPAPAGVDSFHDLYFKGDPDEVEAAFGLPQRRGAYETFYGVTVVDGQPARVKQYVYESQSGFSDWDVVFMMQCKVQRRTDLLGGAG